MLRKGAHFGGDDRKPFAVFLRPRRLNRRIQREHPRLAADVMNQSDLFGDLLHRRDRFRDGLAGLAGVLRRFCRNLLGLRRIFRALPDIRGHFFY